ncbi:uncharacterized protein HMPREF1541_02620 [Cyphellophora europaea CBS 101466]|uniref:Uncharacterized protein n=1 Tax=Cyphellophora europaea (strain CBS 101466) TaxID=1220924 RepID=W2S441_CYPE1|nr:uncharacterized protein HMPREF1541_02620 [Cyphellophora europaea CBS 101466]ETN43461.1 hypothetical protein HMPREF1541_02620 [Cyphellophora europaea CBS 101466]
MDTTLATSNTTAPTNGPTLQAPNSGHFASSAQTIGVGWAIIAAVVLGVIVIPGLIFGVIGLLNNLRRRARTHAVMAQQDIYTARRTHFSRRRAAIFAETARQGAEADVERGVDGQSRDGLPRYDSMVHGYELAVLQRQHFPARTLGPASAGKTPTTPPVPEATRPVWYGGSWRTQAGFSSEDDAGTSQRKYSI